jgi:microsomal dipeptidase-like Zn-dependent dipeptidase
MLIDIDHMSTRSLDETLELTRGTTPQYPLVASHVQFFDLHGMEFGDNAGRHERMRTAAQLAAIRESGGLVAAMTKDDVQDTGKKGAKFTLPYQPLLGAAIADDCRHSSSSFAQAYQYAVDAMGAPVALGSDFNGVAGHVGPRFGSDACGGDLPFSTEASSTIERSAQIRGDRRLEYPFTLNGFGVFDRQVSGLKSFDFNVDGLAHVGLLPDLIKDMETVGLSDTYLEALFNSAEEYIRVWERAKAISEGTPIPTPQQNLSCPPVALCIGADQTPPQVNCPEAPVTECTGLQTDVVFGPAIASADGCGAALSQGCNPFSGSVFELGLTPVICTAIDNSRNVGSCQFDVKVQDTVAPDITAPEDRLQECASPQGTPVTLGASISSDRCDADPILAHDAPAVFPLGATPVIWTSTDDYGNIGTSTQVVTVLDRTPPDLTVVLTPSALWPPNHKLVTVRADIQVSDLCDAAPAITLVSIVSNEPDKGQGDGDTPNDIQGALFGTDDREFQIRAERSGKGNGRLYTITYAATDASGNRTLMQANVTVPKSKKP